MLSRNQLHTHAHRYGHVHGNGYGGDLVGYVVRNATVGPPNRRDAVLLSTCSLAQCPIAFGWAATWYAPWHEDAAEQAEINYRRMAADQLTAL